MDSDEELGGLIERVLPAVVPRDRFRQRGAQLCRFMRLRKACKAEGRPKGIAPHVAERIRRHNADLAIRAEDVIDVCEKKPARVYGTGARKLWRPGAILRVCWGIRPRNRSCQKEPPTASALVASARTWAMFCQGNHAYIASVRAAMAEHLIERVLAACLKEMAVGPWCILELAWDETLEPVRLEARAELTHTMMLHGRLTCMHDGGFTYELVMPPALLESTCAANLWAALSARLPVDFRWLRQHNVTLLLNTDSAPTNFVVGRYLGTMFPTLQPGCRMHQISLTMMAVYRLSGVMSGLFCACLLLRRRQVGVRVRAELQKHIRRELRITHEAPAPDVLQESKSLFALMAPLVDTGHNGTKSQITTRQRALQRLQTLFACSLRGNGEPRLWHYCPYGCHATTQSAADELFQLLATLFLEHPPPVPAWNKWTKVLPPLLWFATFGSVRTCLAASLARVRPSAAPVGDSVLTGPNEDIMIGLSDQQTFQVQDGVRMTKMLKFLLAPAAADKMLAMVLALEPVARCMASLFEGGKREPAATASVLPLIRETKSPAIRAIATSLTQLMNADHPSWVLFLGARKPQSWTEDLLVLASVPLWVCVGNLFARFVDIWRQWPWRLALLVGDELSQEEKRSLAAELFRCSPCDLDPFTRAFKEKAESAEGVTSDVSLQYLASVFEACPASNIQSEQRFSSSAKRRGTSSGNVHGPQTSAAAHVLQEVQTWKHTLGGDSVPPCRSQNVKAKKTPRSSWQAFLQRHRASGDGMAALSDKWAALTAAEKLEYRPKRRSECALAGASAGALVVSSAGPDSSPPGGESFYPVSEAEIADLPGRVRELSSKWRRRIGLRSQSVFRPRNDDFYPPPVERTCERVLGRGLCAEDFEKDELREILSWNERLARWTRICKLRNASIDGVWGKLALFWASGGGAGRVPCGFAFLLLHSNLITGEAVFCVQNRVGLDLKVGDVLSFSDVTLADIFNQTQLTRLLVEGSWEPNFKVHLVEYELVGLAAHRVSALVDISDVERRHKEELATKRALRETLRAAQGPKEDQPREPRAKRARIKPLCPKLAGASRHGAGLDGGDGVPPDGDDGVMLDGGDGVPPNDADSVSEGASSEGGVEAALRKDGVWDDYVAAGEAAEADARAEAGPIYDADTGKVHVLNELGRKVYVGRISWIRVGEPSEAVSVYCSRHQCSVMKRVRFAPTIESMVCWPLLCPFNLQSSGIAKY